MKKHFIISFFLLTLLFSYNIQSDIKPWTVLTFIAGDNDLEPFIDLDLNEMQQGANKNVNVLAFVNTNIGGKQKISKRLVITPGQITQDGPDLLNLDSGHPDTCIQAGLWAIENYPSNKFMIIFWDHGSGSLNRFLIGTINPWNLVADKIKRATLKDKYSKEIERGFCYDDSTGNYLTDRDLQLILDKLSQKLGKKIDIVAFDACLMADIELAYTAKPYADYFVSSQEVIAGTGYQYKFVLDSLAKKDISSKNFATKIVQAYDKCYKISNYDYTLSAISLKSLDPIVENLNSISKFLITGLQSSNNNSLKNAITEAAFSDPDIRFEEYDYMDLYNFYLNLYNLVESTDLKSTEKRVLKRELRTGMYLIRTAVISKVSSPRFSKVRGLSIYLPKRTIDNSYEKLYWTENTNWLKFLQNYFKA